MSDAGTTVASGDNFFDMDGWLTSVLTPDAARTFCENAIFSAIWDALAMRDKTWWFDYVNQRDPEVKRRWYERHCARTLDAYEDLLYLCEWIIAD